MTVQTSLRQQIYFALTELGETTAPVVAQKINTDSRRVSKSIGDMTNKGIIIAKKTPNMLTTYRVNPAASEDMRKVKKRKIACTNVLKRIESKNPLFTCWH